MQNFEHIENKQDLAYNLKKFRENIDMSQQKVADILCIDRSTYAYYETGKTLPDIFTLLKISRIFKVNIYYLLIKNGQELYLKK